jgi:quercetin dioxygenase-like cupin family protein
MAGDSLRQLFPPVPALPRAAHAEAVNTGPETPEDGDMTEHEHSYKVNVADFAADQNLASNDGWVNMAVQFLVDHAHGGARKVVFGRTVFAPGESVHELHRHAGAEEVVYLVRGSGVATNGDEEIVLNVGDIAFHPQGEWHGFYNTSPTEEAEMIWVWAGAASKDDAGYEVKDGASLGHHHE